MSAISPQGSTWFTVCPDRHHPGYIALHLLPAYAPETNPDELVNVT